MDGTQKMGVTFFSVVGVIGLFLSLKGVWGSIAAPFASKAGIALYQTPDEQAAAQAERERKTDTDSDGLSDYDERVLYRTSKYLADSDGDGVNDGEEVEKGKNPNCPEGGDCASTGASAVGSIGGADGLAGIVPGDQKLNAQIKTQADLEAYLNTLTLDQIRVALQDSGVPKEQLDALSDEQLRALFDSALKNVKQNGTTSTAPTAPKSSP